VGVVTVTGPQGTRARAPQDRSATVVVGVDGSAAADAAVVVAADEASRRGAILHVLCLAEEANLDPPGVPGLLRRRRRPRVETAAVVQAAVDSAHSVCPGLPVTAAVVPADPRHVEDACRVRAELEAACLLVLGAHGRTDGRVFAVGSSSAVLAGASSCPLLVCPVPPVRPDPDARAWGVVLAWVDAARPAGVLRVAAEEAARRRLCLHVLHLARAGDDAAAARVGLERAVRRCVPSGVPTHVRIATTLDGTRQEADRGDVRLVVVGSRGTQALAGLRTGSVSRAVLELSRVPVLVVRGRGGPHRDEIG
jgi:nucleotide-binding universal stress UspA family protein